MTLSKKYYWEKILDETAEAIIVTDEKNQIIYKNKFAEKLLSLKVIEIAEIIDLRSMDKTLIKEGKTYSVRHKSFQSSEFPVNIWYIADITDKKRMDQELRLFNAILDSISEGVIASTPDGIVTVYNKQLEKLEGRNREQLLGKHITEVYDVTKKSSEHLIVLETGRPINDINLNYIANNKEMHIVSSTFPLQEEGSTTAVYSISRDVTGIRQLFLRTIETVETRRVGSGKEHLKNGTTFTFNDIIYNCSSIKQVIRDSQRAAISPSPILVFGETGTGKELIVQGIHNAGTNRNEMFMAINCAAIPDSLLESLLFGTVRGAFTGAEDMRGLFEQVGKGTLYLDEINSMAIRLQAKILRVFQEKKIRRVGANKEVPINCRIISSTNVDPWQSVEDGTLRKDLYYRLAVIQIYLPPLRERIEDIESLIDHFISKYGKIYGRQSIKISEKLLNLLKQYSWPGNVRELEHVIENSMAMMDEDEAELTFYRVPYPFFTRMKSDFRKMQSDEITNLREILTDVEKKTILNALNLHNWNITKAAEYIGIGRQNLQYRISKLGIKRPGN